MRRADRLFNLIQILRRSSQPVTALALAAELEVSKRTVYRDVADLVGQRVPIEGEPGFGYVLSAGYDMPPLMLTPDEIEAVVLGTQWVAQRSDPSLANAARDVMAKIGAILPKHLRAFITDASVGAKPRVVVQSLDLRGVRLAIREGKKLKVRYRTPEGVETERTLWPVLLGYDEANCLLIAWCELRQDFRHFRTDRLLEVEALEMRYDLGKAELRRRWHDWRLAAILP